MKRARDISEVSFQLEGGGFVVLKRRTPQKAAGSHLDQDGVPARSAAAARPSEICDVFPILFNVLDGGARRGLGAACRAANAAYRHGVLRLALPWQYLRVLPSVAARFPSLQHLRIINCCTLMSAAAYNDHDIDRHGAPEDVPPCIAYFRPEPPPPQRLLTSEIGRLIGRLSGLREIVVPAGVDVSAEGAAALAAGLWQLRQLDLAGRGVGPAGACGLAVLTNLESLRLGWCHIGTEAAAALTALTGLRCLSLPGNWIGPEAVPRLAASLTRLESLDLAHNLCMAPAAAGPAALARLDRLARLDAAATGLTAAGLRALAGGVARFGALDVSLNDESVLEGVLPDGALAAPAAQACAAAAPLPQPPRGLRQLRALGAACVGVGLDEARALASLGGLSELRLSRRNDCRAVCSALAPLRARNAVFWV